MTDNATVCRHCADRWYLLDTNCIKCPENCSLCVSSKKCLECESNLYHGKTCNLTCNTACMNKTCDITGNCKHVCDNSKYGKECDKECLKHCKTCLNSTMCLECEAGYFGKSCQMCPENCKTCENNSACTYCKSSLTYDNGKCLEKSIKKHTNDNPDTTCINGDANDDSSCKDQRAYYCCVIHLFTLLEEALNFQLIFFLIYISEQLTPLIASVVPILLMIVVFCLIVWQMKQKWYLFS